MLFAQVVDEANVIVEGVGGGEGLREVCVVRDLLRERSSRKVQVAVGGAARVQCGFQGPRMMARV